ncbi:MAG TPA: hypothetical protein VKY74_02325 [Chloroflexia bacterium]|nr:hypothetical protein [Chloroflexia bacterium]
MKYLICVGLIAAALLGLDLLTHAPDPAADYLALQRAELQAEQDRAAAARWSAFWDVAVPAGGFFLLALAGGGAVLAVDAYRQRRRPLVQLGPVVVDRTRLHSGAYDGLLTGIVAGHYTAAIEAARNVGTPYTFSPHVVYGL